MKEIGGYFGLENLINNEYYKNLIPLNNGRNALLYLLRAKKIKKLYIPYCLCDSIPNMLKMYDYKFEYYNIDAEFIPIFNKVMGKDEYLYIVNYYGQLSNEKISELKQKYNRIIIDNTQAFFQNPVEKIDTIYTCRKFFGVPDGAYLSTDVKIKDNLEIDISKDRMQHILGRYEGMASEYYNDFQNNEEILKKESLKYMSKLTHNILGAIDYQEICKIRNSNYAYLESKLSVYNKIKFKTSNGAFAYPFYIKNGIEVRKKLAQYKIYVPTLWPNVLTNSSENSLEYDYVANILPLPCDQRYFLQDMQYIVQEMIKFE